MHKTKIIATLGPACENTDTITQMLHSGLNVFRINSSHSHSFIKIHKTIKKIRTEAKKLHKSVSIMMDLGGPKIRIALPKNKTNIQIRKGQTYRVGFKKYEIPLNTKIKILKIHKKATIKIDDGKINFKVLKLETDHIMVCALNGGEITKNKGVNFPGLSLKLPAVTVADKKHIKTAIDLGLYF